MNDELRAKVVDLFARAGCGLAHASVCRILRTGSDELAPIFVALIIEGLLEIAPYGGLRPTKVLRARDDEMLAESRRIIDAARARSAKGRCACGSSMTVYSKQCRACLRSKAADKRDAKVKRDQVRTERRAAKIEAQIKRAAELAAIPKPSWSTEKLDDAEYVASRRRLRANTQELRNSIIASRRVNREMIRQKELADAAAVAALAGQDAKKTAGIDLARKARIEDRKNSDISTPPPTITAIQVDESPSDDPWAKIKARTYAKPPLMASNLRQLSPQELMTGRVRRRG